MGVIMVYKPTNISGGPHPVDIIGFYGILIGCVWYLYGILLGLLLELYGIVSGWSYLWWIEAFRHVGGCFRDVNDKCIRYEFNQQKDAKAYISQSIIGIHRIPWGEMMGLDWNSWRMTRNMTHFGSSGMGLDDQLPRAFLFNNGFGMIAGDKHVLYITTNIWEDHIYVYIHYISHSEIRKVS